jgi:hypothetical protein
MVVRSTFRTGTIGSREDQFVLVAVDDFAGAADAAGLTDDVTGFLTRIVRKPSLDGHHFSTGRPSIYAVLTLLL